MKKEEQGAEHESKAGYGGSKGSDPNRKEAGVTKAKLDKEIDNKKDKSQYKDVE